MIIIVLNLIFKEQGASPLLCFRPEGPLISVQVREVCCLQESMRREDCEDWGEKVRRGLPEVESPRQAITQRVTVVWQFAGPAALRSLNRGRVRELPTLCRS